MFMASKIFVLGVLKFVKGDFVLHPTTLVFVFPTYVEENSLLLSMKSH